MMNEENERVDFFAASYQISPFDGKRYPDYNPNADTRLYERWLPCAYCKHRLHIANPFTPSSKWTCKAFPTGIPWPIQVRIRNHDQILADQEGDYVYEYEKCASFPDGYNYLTFDGKWVTEEMAKKGR